jgi:hypothetical protein
MEAAAITATAGLAAVIIAVIGLAATAIYRIGKLTEAANRLPQEMHAEFQRIYDRISQNESLAEERFQRHEELIRHNEELIRHNEDLIRSEGERTREQIRNLQQAIMSHSHDEDGNIIFRIPPPETDE